MRLKNLILGGLLLFALSSCDTKKEVKTIEVQEFKTEIAKPDVQLIDVRDAELYSEGHIPGAMNIELSSENFVDMIQTLDKENPVAVYCRGGGQSAEAAQKLHEAGFEVVELQGGFLTWDGEVEK